MKMSPTVKKVPTMGPFLDDEEKAIVEAIAQDDYHIGKSHLSAGRIRELQAAARSTTNEERTKISLRVSKSDLERLKVKALREGMPYQTLINSILHKAASS